MGWVSMPWPGTPPTAATAAARIASSRGATSNPGLVQNCPAPRVKEPTQPSAIAAPRSAAALGVMNIGLMLPSSP